MADIQAADLANTVTAFATIFGGAVPLALTALTGRPQPARWLRVYWGIVVTGIATVWYHGFGEQVWAGLADGGTNLLLAWLLQIAVLWDYYPRRLAQPIALISAMVNAAVILWRAVYGPSFSSLYLISFGAFGGFHPMEIMLILDCLFIVGLFFFSFSKITASARPLLYLMTGIFFLGALLATASNQRIDFHIVCYHALWHVVGAFGFVVMWVFNDERFRGSIGGIELRDSIGKKRN